MCHCEPSANCWVPALSAEGCRPEVPIGFRRDPELNSRDSVGAVIFFMLSGTASLRKLRADCFVPQSDTKVSLRTQRLFAGCGNLLHVEWYCFPSQAQGRPLRLQ
jgi:hypothetical protein